MRYFAVLPASVTADTYVDLLRGGRCCHYKIPGIEHLWGFGDTDQQAIADLDRKIRSIRKALEQVS